MRHNHIAGPGLALIALTVQGCGQASEPVAAPPDPTPAVAEAAPVTARYVCDSGLTVAVAWADPQTAQVSYRDRIYVLRAAPVASGARFIDGEVEWRTRTDDGVERATLSRLVARDAPVVLERCSRPAPAPVVPPAGPAPAAVVSAPCRGAQLRLTAEGGDAGAGNRVSAFALQNVGAAPCSLNGHPGVTLQDGEGRALSAIRSVPVLGGYFTGGVTPAPVELEPQARAFFDLAWSAIPHEGQGERACPTAARLRVTAPGDASPVTVDQTLQPCGGRVQVTPFRPVRDSVAPAPDPAG